MNPMVPVMGKMETVQLSTDELVKQFRAEQIEKAKETAALTLQEQKAQAKRQQEQAQQAPASTVVSLSQEGIEASKKAE